MSSHTLAYASISRRLLAATFDAALFFLTITPIWIVVEFIQYRTHFLHRELYPFIGLIINHVGFFLYFVIFPASVMRTTPGKKVCNIRILSKEGERAGLMRLFSRACIQIICIWLFILLYGLWIYPPLTYFDNNIVDFGYNSFYSVSLPMTLTLWTILLSPLYIAHFNREKATIYDWLCKTRVVVDFPKD